MALNRWGEHREIPFLSSREEINARRGKFSKDRGSYLQALVTEFQETDDQSAKEQILAHLANFCYDPVNYEWLRQLNVIDLFLDMLTEDSPKLKEFGIGGLCNLCNDPRNTQIIVENGGIPLIMKCLSSPHEETVLSSITILFYLLNHSETIRSKILTKSLIRCMKKYSESSNVRLSNLALVFLQESGVKVEDEH